MGMAYNKVIYRFEIWEETDIKWDRTWIKEKE